MSALKQFYFTFGQRYRTEPHPLGTLAHPDGYVCVEAENSEEARKFMHSLCGLAWSGCYYEPPEDRYYPRGEVKRYTVEAKST